MAVEKAEEEEEAGAGSSGTGEQANPKKGSAGGASSLEELADQAIAENLGEIVACILENVRNKHLPSVKLLFDVAARLKANEKIPEAEFVSFARVLLEGQATLVEIPAEATSAGDLSFPMCKLGDGSTAVTDGDAPVGIG